MGAWKINNIKVMKNTIRDFAKQFAWEPKIVQRPSLRFSKFVVCGMGGSNLTVGLLKIADPGIDAVEHRNYGLPPLSAAQLRQRLAIAVSYSGNTEETISSFEEARKRKLPLAAVAVGGKLIARAKKYRVPYVQIPDTGIPPRMALGFTTNALLKLMGNTELFAQATALAHALKPRAFDTRGRRFARALKNHVPIIYASDANRMIAYNWKIKFNETGKIPAFYNVLPELNHNEMTGFDARPRSRHLSKLFHFIVLTDDNDHPRIRRRMEVTERLYRARKFPMENVRLKGESALHKIFSSLTLADWIAFYSARQYGLEPEQVPMVEEFKRII